MFSTCAEKGEEIALKKLLHRGRAKAYSRSIHFPLEYFDYAFKTHRGTVLRYRL
jgi:hypothetical protein